MCKVAQHTRQEAFRPRGRCEFKLPASPLLARWKAFQEPGGFVGSALYLSPNEVRCRLSEIFFGAVT